MESTALKAVRYTPPSLKLCLGRLPWDNTYRAIFHAISLNIMHFIFETFVEASCLFTLKVIRSGLLCQIIAFTLELRVPRIAFASIDPMVIHRALSIDLVNNLAVLYLCP